MLETIHAGGILAYCSDLIVEGDEEDLQAYFISVGGQQTAVKGILASLLENKTLTLVKGSQYYHVTRANESYQMKIKRLPSGGCQGIAFPRSIKINQEQDDYARQFFLLSPDQNQTRSLFFRHLEARLDIPLHETWTNWLWRIFADNGWLTRLVTLCGSYEGFLVTLRLEELIGEISLAIRGNVFEVTACLGLKEQRSWAPWKAYLI